jgi:hypothetical protein
VKERERCGGMMVVSDAPFVAVGAELRGNTTVIIPDVLRYRAMCRLL